MAELCIHLTKTEHLREHKTKDESWITKSSKRETDSESLGTLWMERMGPASSQFWFWEIQN